MSKINQSKLTLLSIMIAVSLCTFSACTSSARNPAKSERPWQSIFNGKGLSGWKIKCTAQDSRKNFFRVEDSTILADSMADPNHDYIWLLTNKEYADFTLKLKFQAYRDSPGNSGIQIRSRYDDNKRWLDGPQIDINPPGPWRTGMIWDETRDNLRWLYPDLPKDKWVDESMAEPNLRFYYSDDSPCWNDLQITAVGTKVTAILNGVTITDYDGTGVLDDNLHKKYNVGLSGRIALQIHKNDRLKIRFKDILIKDLSE
ncbi:MAG: 3-keto-disaccharide hydrolase [Planctomycetota bacterium]|jgi:hypothetical protein